MKQMKIPPCEPVSADERMQRELDRHRRIERAFGFVLVAQDRESWQGFSFILRARLSREEAAALAWAAMKAANPEDAARIAAEVSSVAGAPLAPFLSVMHEARAWAAIASEAERKAYTLAGFEALPTAEQRAFLAWAGEGSDR